MKVKGKSLSLLGKTTKGILVVGNLFAQYDTRGIPLDIVLEGCKEAGVIPCWISYWQDAEEAGWKRNKIWATIEYALRDCRWPETEEILERLERWEKSSE